MQLAIASYYYVYTATYIFIGSTSITGSIAVQHDCNTSFLDCDNVYDRFEVINIILNITIIQAGYIIICIACMYVATFVITYRYACCYLTCCMNVLYSQSAELVQPEELLLVTKVSDSNIAGTT